MTLESQMREAIRKALDECDYELPGELQWESVRLKLESHLLPLLEEKPVSQEKCGALNEAESELSKLESGL